MTRFMPGDWVAYQGQGYSTGRIGQVLEVNDDGRVRCGYEGRSSRTTTKLLVRWEAGFYTQKTTWVTADWCRPLPSRERAIEAPSLPLWEIPEIAAVVDAFDQVDWRGKPPWPPLIEAIDALREPVVPDAMRAEDI